MIGVFCWDGDFVFVYCYWEVMRGGRARCFVVGGWGSFGNRVFRGCCLEYAKVDWFRAGVG